MGSALPRVCIIGAGTSGLICAKVMKERGIPFDCFEKGSGVGGLWRFNNDNGASTCYRSLHINTSKRIMQLSDYPFPDHVPEYPGHAEILQYFEDYCDHFGVRPHITFKTTVQHAERLPDGLWQVDISGPTGEERRYYDAVIVANGHHWDPRTPQFPGHFDGIQFHAHHYVDLDTPHDLRGKRVVVVGSGNSAMDIVCELGQAYRAGQGPSRVFLSQRSGVWITPKVLGNFAQDAALRHAMKRPGAWERFSRRYIPRGIRKAFADFMAQNFIKLIAGSPQRVGLKAPLEPYSKRHGTISQDIHSRLIHGDITPKGNIRELAGDRVIFEDGSSEQADVLIHCTGYRITFPFFDPQFISAPGNDIGLWHRIFDPRYDNLMFLALVQPRCAMMPIAELQSHFMADYLTGQYHLPAKSVMTNELQDYHEGMKSEFTQSASHTIQIDCEEYSYLLYEEWDQGKQRAASAGRGLPIPARASQPDTAKAA